MVLDGKSWYVRLFFWSLGIWGAFLGDPHYALDWRYTMKKEGTNLCFFIRVTFIYMPFALLVNFFVLAVVIASLTILPIYLYGAVTYMWIWLALAGSVLAIAGLVFLLWGIDTVASYARRKRYQRQRRSLTKETTASPVGFSDVISLSVKAVQEKVCPVITFHDAKEAEQ